MGFNIHNIHSVNSTFGKKAEPIQPKQIKGLEKTTKITSEYFVYNGIKIYIDEDRPYFKIPDTTIKFNRDLRHPVEFSCQKKYIDDESFKKIIPAQIGLEHLEEVRELAREIKAQLANPKKIYFTTSNDGELLSGAKITIGGNVYIACYRGTPVQRDEEGFYYISKSEHNNHRGDMETVIDRHNLKNNEIEFICTSEKKVSKYLSFASRGGASQKIKAPSDKVPDKKIMGYIDVCIDGFVAPVKYDGEKPYVIIKPFFKEQRRYLTPNEVETCPVYWDAEKGKYYFEDARVGGKWLIKRYINTEEDQHSIRKTEKR